MLVLSRKCQESVVVGGQVGGEYGFKVTVVEVKAGSVRLGFDADRDVPVHRLEVWERIRAGTGQAARRSSPDRFGRDRDSGPVEIHSKGVGSGAPLRESEHSYGAGVEVRATSTSGSRNI